MSGGREREGGEGAGGRREGVGVVGGKEKKCAARGRREGDVWWE
jgi:hypothetical protein